MAVATLAVAWRLLRDHLDKERALFGLAALFCRPALYGQDRGAQRQHGDDAVLGRGAARLPAGPAADSAPPMPFFAGAFASLAVLGKYWAGVSPRRHGGRLRRRRRDETFLAFARPYVMAAGAAIVLTPHAIWLVTEPRWREL